ncbi:alcohol dehydrogenase catalytic domain-containing protein [Kribbella sp. GL6]|uniref:alcohol dehydrogenase catalytic domain-containing protein n=1 Tax=Kribbella sp. GL6 TaxID=3419765 RepID=UPI003D06F8E3
MLDSVSKRSILRLSWVTSWQVSMKETSRAVQFESFGGPEALSVREVPAPQAGPGQIRVRVTAAGLNPMDWYMTSDAETAGRFGLSLPCGFGTDYAGVVDQVGDGVSEYAVGDRVYGGAMSRAVADHVVVDVTGTIALGGEAHRTPDGVDDRTAATLTIAGRTAAAALAVVNPAPGETILIGGAGGGVGAFAVQLARIAGARVIGTGSPASADALRALGAEPITYGPALADRLRALAPTDPNATAALYRTDADAITDKYGTGADATSERHGTNVDAVTGRRGTEVDAVSERHETGVDAVMGRRGGGVEASADRHGSDVDVVTDQHRAGADVTTGQRETGADAVSERHGTDVDVVTGQHRAGADVMTGQRETGADVDVVTDQH